VPLKAIFISKPRETAKRKVAFRPVLLAANSCKGLGKRNIEGGLGNYTCGTFTLNKGGVTVKKPWQKVEPVPPNGTLTSQADITQLNLRRKKEDVPVRDPYRKWSRDSQRREILRPLGRCDLRYRVSLKKGKY